MPELPEVEIVKNYLSRFLIGKTPLQIKVLNNKLRYSVPQNIHDIQGAKIISINRQGKYLIIKFDNSLMLVIHLGMSGRLFISDVNYIRAKHDHLLIYFDDLILIYNDARKFGLIDVINQTQDYKLFKTIGIEPLSEDLSLDVIYSLLSKSKMPIKHFLMNSKFIAGIGNIYANEILFESKIHPNTICSLISDKEASCLLQSIKNILKKAIKLGGSSIRDFTDPKGIKGQFTNNLTVYGRSKLPCYICGNKIQSYKMQGRSTFFCPGCQRAK